MTIGISSNGKVETGARILLGAGADLRNLAGAQYFILAGFICILVHFAFILVGARLFRVDVSMAAVASVAAVGGAASAPVSPEPSGDATNAACPEIFNPATVIPSWASAHTTLSDRRCR